MIGASLLSLCAWISWTAGCEQAWIDLFHDPDHDRNLLQWYVASSVGNVILLGFALCYIAHMFVVRTKPAYPADTPQETRTKYGS